MFVNEMSQLETCPQAQINEITDDRYSRITNQLKLQGTPIPTNDIWITAQTMEYGAELITSDRYFEKVNGLVYTIL
jgi:tRNA(fMet)-specific endonuclease VapC